MAGWSWAALSHEWDRAGGRDPLNSTYSMFERYFDDGEKLELKKVTRMDRFLDLVRNMKWFLEPWTDHSSWTGEMFPGR